MKRIFLKIYSPVPWAYMVHRYRPWGLGLIYYSVNSRSTQHHGEQLPAGAWPGGGGRGHADLRGGRQPARHLPLAPQDLRQAADGGAGLHAGPGGPDPHRHLLLHCHQLPGLQPARPRGCERALRAQHDGDSQLHGSPGGGARLRHPGLSGILPSPSTVRYTAVPHGTHVLEGKEVWHYSELLVINSSTL